jgi:1-deoxy-D-xylulose-5-phosphate reductoisomerase
LDWSALRRLDFEDVPPRKFRCFELAREAARRGGPLPCALNAADEIAVAAFLERRLSFLGIAAVIERVLEQMPRGAMHSVDDVLAADAEARRLARLAVDRNR